MPVLPTMLFSTKGKGSDDIQTLSSYTFNNPSLHVSGTYLHHLFPLLLKGHKPYLLAAAAVLTGPQGGGPPA